MTNLLGRPDPDGTGDREFEGAGFGRVAGVCFAAVGGDVALEPEGRGLRVLPLGSGVFWDAWRVWVDEPALRVDVNETSAFGGRGEVACTRARAAGVATIESAA